MQRIGTGDKTQILMLRRAVANLRQNTTQLTQELASGQKQDKPRAMGGALVQLASVEHGIQAATQHAKDANTAASFLSAQQVSVAQFGEITSRVSLDLRTSTNAQVEPLLSEASDRARAGFEDSIRLLNTKAAGRFVFSGIAGDQQSFDDPGAILDAVVAGIPPGSSPADIQTHVNAWFDTGGPFDTTAYQGQEPASASIDLGSGQSVSFDVSGQEQAFREGLAGLALGAIANALSPDLSSGDMRSLLHRSSDALTQSAGSQIALEARIGFKQASVAEAVTQAQARRTSFEIVRTELLQADPYDTALALESATQRLEAIFMVTSRLSRLSLTEYLR